MPFRILMFIVLFFGYSEAANHQKDMSMKEKIGQMILIGFHGVRKEDPEVKQVLELARQGKIGGVIFFGYNLQNPPQIKALVNSFHHVSSPYPLFLAIDQEGGKVQRLNAKNGFKNFLSAKKVAETLTPEEALDHYREMARLSKAAKFNLIFGPDVDLDYKLPKGKPGPVIGALERSYSADVGTVVDYASAFINAHREKGLLTSLKHFPGHGFAQADSHQGLVDVTKTADPLEQQPFYRLIEDAKADMIMTAHLMNQKWDKDYPATLSPQVIQTLLREKAGYEGVVITDDLHMGAIGQYYALEEIVIQAVQAGNDILLFSNNQAAAQGVKNFKGNSEISTRIGQILVDAVEKGIISEDRINQSYQRIIALKKKLSNPHRG